jgi:hypothetical protein
LGALLCGTICCLAPPGDLHGIEISGEQHKVVERNPEFEERLAKLGIRTLRGKHLVLLTDLPVAADIDRLADLFDLAVPQWAAYFNIPRTKWADWQMTGYLMSDPERFRICGLFPDRELPAFKSGFSRGNELWMFKQQSDYYCRHLLFHEGVHGFMSAFFPTLSPPWHAEGMAELLATHRWGNGRLTVAYFPRDKMEVPMLGRIRIVKDQVAGGRILPLESVLSYGAQAHRDNAAYGWCWAVAAFLDGHPSYRDRFRQLNQKQTGSKMSEAVRKTFAEDWDRLSEEWLIFVTGIEHGHDLSSSAIQYREGKTLPPEGVRLTLAANRGWQSSGVLLEAGQSYQIRAAGRYELQRDANGKSWWCEPGGITLRYVHGQPLGILLGAVRPGGTPPAGSRSLIAPQPVGLEKRWAPGQSGTLYLRINDVTSGLADNQGQLDVVISRMARDAPETTAP